jgi:hypothetical protein
MMKKVRENMSSIIGTPDILQKLGISNIVRVSPGAYAEIAAGGAAPTDLPLGIKVVEDPDLVGEQWELGPKPAASAASEPQAGGPAT